MTGMRRVIAVHVVLAVALLLAPLTPVALHGSTGSADAITGPVDHLRNEFGGLGDRETAREPVSAEVLVTLKLRANASLPARQGLEVKRTYSRQGATHIEGYVPLTSVRDLSTDPAVEAVRMQSAADPGGRVAPGVAWIGADGLHERGWTGENVTVGVIDAEFRVSDPELAGHVAAYRSFDGTGAPGHGTAVASVVADTAPDADLHLAAVGDSTTATEYRRAVRWLRASGADVIVDAGSYFGRHGEGTDPLSTVATNASGSAVVVTSAGNYGQRHWTGTREGEGWVAFAPGTEGNVLAGNEVTRGRIRASLRWEPARTNATAANHSAANGSTSGPADYDLYLFRRGLRGPSVVAKATGSTGSDSVYLDTTVPRGRYYLAVRGSNVSQAQELELFASRDLSEQVANGSITTPATAPGVIAVGAYDRSREAVAPFSSRGPVGNGTGVDLVAPDAVAAPGTGAESGTSFAAPYVAGTAALLQSRYPELSAAETRSLLVSSTRDIGPEGPDVASGQGVLDAGAAAALAEDRARYAAVNTGTDSGATTEFTAAENPFQPPAPAVALAARQDLAAITNGTNVSDRTVGTEADRPTGATPGP